MNSKAAVLVSKNEKLAWVQEMPGLCSRARQE